ncbi:MAG: cell division protein SepF [Candidatus Hydrothermarchaeales archaeon]
MKRFILNKKGRGFRGIRMGLKELFTRMVAGGPSNVGVTDTEDYVRLEPESEFGAGLNAPERYVSVYKLRGFSDVDGCTTQLSDGNIVLLDIKPLADRSVTELKHAIDEIKDICLAMGSDIAGIGENHLILTPPNVKILRTKGEGFETTMNRIRSRIA